MAVASFNDLCAGYCEILRVPAPALHLDEHGRVGFHVRLHGAVVNLVHCPERAPDHVFIVFELGAAGDSRAALLALLEANYNLLEVHPPTVSCNPATGDLVLQFVYPLFEATANDLHELIEQGCEWSSRWREAFEAQEDVGPALVTDGQSESFGMLNRA
jgi:hypothetical protein